MVLHHHCFLSAYYSWLGRSEVTELDSSVLSHLCSSQGLQIFLRTDPHCVKVAAKVSLNMNLASCWVAFTSLAVTKPKTTVASSIIQLSWRHLKRG